MPPISSSFELLTKALSLRNPRLTLALVSCCGGQSISDSLLPSCKASIEVDSIALGGSVGFGRSLGESLGFATRVKDQQYIERKPETHIKRAPPGNLPCDSFTESSPKRQQRVPSQAMARQGVHAFLAMPALSLETFRFTSQSKRHQDSSKRRGKA